MFLVTFLPAQTTCKAAYTVPVSTAYRAQQGQDCIFDYLPERDLLCNLLVLSRGPEGIFAGGDSDSTFLVTLGLGVAFFFVAGILMLDMNISKSR